MKAYSLFYIICCIYRNTSIKIKPELKKDILKCVYGINYKYGIVLACSFDRFYVVTQFILPTAEGLTFSTLNFNKDCKYLRDTEEEQTEETILNLMYIFMNSK